MPARAASPAYSDAEVDIGQSLFADEDEQHSHAPNGDHEFDVDGILAVPQGGPDGGDEDDEAFIALQQAASYRKASNLKGRTVKRAVAFKPWVGSFVRLQLNRY